MWRALAAVAVLALHFAACSAAQRVTPLEGVPPDRGAAPENQERLRTVLSTRLQDSRDDREYTVAPGDLLAITIYNFRPGGGNFESDVRIDDRGYVSLPIMQPVRAAGLTVAELRQALVEAMQASGVLNQPLVSVFLKDYRGQRVTLLGEVAHPGQYHLSQGEQTLVDVISMAGGLTNRAGNYVLFRPARSGATRASLGGEIEHAYALKTVAAAGPLPDAGSDMIVFRLDSAAAADRTLLTLPVRGGDLFIVPDAGQAFVEGEVDKPGPYPLTHGMTITQVLTSAGGLTFPANRRRVTLVRNSGFGTSAQWEVDTERIRNEEQPDVLLEPNDRVVVPATTGRKIAYGVYQTVTRIITFTVGGAARVY
jgi:polysaccharide export outer membrane protein